LQKQIQRLLVVDAKAAAKPGTVGWKRVKELDISGPQLLAQSGHFLAESGKISRNG